MQSLAKLETVLQKITDEQPLQLLTDYWLPKTEQEPKKQHSVFCIGCKTDRTMTVDKVFLSKNKRVFIGGLCNTCNRTCSVPANRIAVQKLTAKEALPEVLNFARNFEQRLCALECQGVGTEFVDSLAKRVEETTERQLKEIKQAIIGLKRKVEKFEMECEHVVKKQKNFTN